MGGIAEKMLSRRGHGARRARDREPRAQVIAADLRIEPFENEIEERAILMIARRQPLAVDLREIVTAHPRRRGPGAHRRSGQEHRQARRLDRERAPAAAGGGRRPAHAQDRP